MCLSTSHRLIHVIVSCALPLLGRAGALRPNATNLLHLTSVLPPEIFGTMSCCGHEHHHHHGDDADHVKPGEGHQDLLYAAIDREQVSALNEQYEVCGTGQWRVAWIS